MTKTIKSPQEQEAIVAEYLLGKATYRQLGKKYDVDFRILHSWVMKFQGKQTPRSKATAQEVATLTQKEPSPVLALREELRQEKLRNELLNTIIAIAEKDLNIGIRKKFGTKQ